MKFKLSLLSLILFISCNNTYSLTTENRDSLFAFNSPEMNKKYPFKAAVETFGLNLGVWAFDRYVMNEDFAKITINTIRHNINYGFVWDNDQFSTNLFAHPYHGSLYFNTARSNGLSFWESAPYSLAGSLMWEFTAEREPAAINDLMATTLGGIALGEFTHRMSSLVLNDSKRGGERFLREFLGTLICPIRGLNRLINGDMWRVRHSYYKYHDYEKIPVKFSMGFGMRYLADDNHMFKGEYNPYINLKAVYGDPLDKEDNSPYDYFTANVSLGLSSNQPLINKINLLGRIWGTNVKESSEMNISFGIFQHFNYYDSEAVLHNSENIPYKISEAASVGPGMIYKLPRYNSMLGLQQSIYISAVLLGGSLSDYYNVIDRNYNMGSGYSLKNDTDIDFGRYGNFSLKVSLLNIFTWKGYENKDLNTTNPLYLNAQGDKGNVMLVIINPQINLNLNNNIKANIEASYFVRKSHYSYKDDVSYKTFETRLGLIYQF